MKALKKMTTLAMGIAAIAVSAQTASAEKWDMPMAYAATNFHSEMGVVFADKVREYTNGDIDITVHPGVHCSRAAKSNAPSRQVRPRLANALCPRTRMRRPCLAGITCPSWQQHMRKTTNYGPPPKIK